MLFNVCIIIILILQIVQNITEYIPFVKLVPADYYGILSVMTYTMETCVKIELC